MRRKETEMRKIDRSYDGVWAWDPLRQSWELARSPEWAGSPPEPKWAETERDKLRRRAIPAYAGRRSVGAPSGPPTAVETLRQVLAARGEIPAVTVSSAQASGAAGAYPYYGAVRYVVRLTCWGYPTLSAEERARSDRRSRALAVSDARDLAEAEGRIVVEAKRGRISEDTAEAILAEFHRLRRAHRIED